MDKVRFNRITTLALPIIGGMVSQNVLNLVDTAMVGRLGNFALAAVGIGGFCNWMGQSLILGISPAVQAMAARRKGEGKISEAAHPLNSALILVVITAIILTTIYIFTTPYLFPYLNSDPRVIEKGVPYLQIRLLSTVFVGCNFAFRGFWNAVDMSKVYMNTLIVMHASNIILNYLLIFGKFGFPQMGVEGAATATAISTIIGTFIYFYQAKRKSSHMGFLKSVPKTKHFKALLKLAIPNCMQQLFFSAGWVAMYWVVGKIGTLEVAAANVLINIMLVAILPGLALGLAAATLSGQALGRKDPDDALRWGMDVCKVGVLGITVLAIPMIFFPKLLLSVFIHDPKTLEVATLPMRLTGLLLPLDSVGLILMNALLGVGDTKRVMYVSIFFQWIFYLPLAYLVGPVLGYGLLGVWLIQGTYRILQSIIFTSFWKGAKWKEIQV
jgi:multidrug resistance protein, MATE family